VQKLPRYHGKLFCATGNLGPGEQISWFHIRLGKTQKTIELSESNPVFTLSLGLPSPPIPSLSMVSAK